MVVAVDGSRKAGEREEFIGSLLPLSFEVAFDDALGERDGLSTGAGEQEQLEWAGGLLELVHLPPPPSLPTRVTLFPNSSWYLCRAVQSYSLSVVLPYLTVRNVS